MDGSVSLSFSFSFYKYENKSLDEWPLEFKKPDKNISIFSKYRQGLVFNIRNKTEKHTGGLHDGARMLSLDPNILLYIYSDYIMYMTVTYILRRAQR